MPGLTVWVLGKPDDRHLTRLAPRRGDDTFVIGNDPAVFASAPAPDALFYWSGGRGLLEAIWPKATGVRWVHVPSAGLDHVLFPALAHSSVTLTHAHGHFSRILAEFVMAAVLFFAKDLRRMMHSQAEGHWDPFDVGELHGAVMGIVGYGDIGGAVAERARAFGMSVLGLRRRPEQSANDPRVEEVLPTSACLELMRRSDYVVVAAPLTEETRGLVGQAEIEAMRPSAVLVNIGRGAVVDEPALVRALEQERIRGAALDVFAEEPLPADHPFFRLGNVLLSPHCADHTAGWRDGLVDRFLDNLERFRRGEPLAHVVPDKQRGY
jgi:phosphoglycerate dehydrogenase-like enzyme